MTAQDHDFYLRLAYGVSAALLVVELLSLWLRSRRTRQTQERRQP